MYTNIKHIANLGTFPPTNCGIATFTSDLVKSINRLPSCNTKAAVIAIADKRQRVKYSPEVKWVIDWNTISDYRKAAEDINKSDICLVNVQHEFALYGGAYGAHILEFYNYLRKPIVTTCHTVFANYPAQQLDVFREIYDESKAVIVTTPIATRLLREQGLSNEKMHVIPHGCPNIRFIDTETAKAALGLNGRLVISTFGLITRSKGIEYVIEALPRVLEEAPNLLYLVIGKTHTHALDKEKEKYREELQSQVERLKLQKHVQFVNRFLSRKELIQYLQATDIYITPYTAPDQISSGALTYALGAGKATISTPYHYARDVLADDRGILCEFNDSTSIANAIRRYLDSGYRLAVAEKAYRYSRQFLWPRVAKEYCTLFNKITSS
jgi:glycosyltransferase involved in cell wall biosynthesis